MKDSSLPPPLEFSETFQRVIRTDSLDTLGTSTLTLFEDAVRDGRISDGVALLQYFWDEVLRIGEALFQWMEDIIAYRLERDGLDGEQLVSANAILKGIRHFDPSSGDRERVKRLLVEGDIEGAIVASELARVRYAALHDAYVAWIQGVLEGIAGDYGEDAVLDVVVRAYERLWKVRYESWDSMSPEDRLRLTVEGMRGHLSGPNRRGDVGLEEEEDRYVMTLDPCGSCGILRRGDPESGREPADPESNKIAHPWTWFETGKSWYSVHSPIVMEWIDMERGRRPMRPQENCDRDGPCRWFVYKDPDAARPEHYLRMGFVPPQREEPS